MTEGKVISWQIEVPLITNPFMLRHVAEGLVVFMILMFLLFGTILGIANGWQGVRQGLIITLALGGFWIFISLITLGLVLGNRYKFEYLVGEKGIVMISREKRAQFVHRLALILGLFAKNMAAAGAGLSGIATEQITVPWKQVKGLQSYPKAKVICLLRKFLPKFYIYCTDQNFEEILKITKHHI